LEAAPAIDETNPSCLPRRRTAEEESRKKEERIKDWNMILKREYLSSSLLDKIIQV
jgi:hypothetical protein